MGSTMAPQGISKENHCGDIHTPMPPVVLASGNADADANLEGWEGDWEEGEEAQLSQDVPQEDDAYVIVDLAVASAEGPGDMVTLDSKVPGDVASLSVLVVRHIGSFKPTH